MTKNIKAVAAAVAPTVAIVAPATAGATDGVDVHSCSSPNEAFRYGQGNNVRRDIANRVAVEEFEKISLDQDHVTTSLRAAGHTWHVYHRIVCGDLSVTLTMVGGFRAQVMFD